MVDTEIYSYEDRVKQIDRVEFGIFGNAELLENSALGKDTLGVVQADLYDNLEPKVGGLIDPKMGPSDNTVDCLTCGLNNTYCVGHFGHITLADPVFHMGYMVYIKKILSCICLSCSKLLVHKNELEIAEMLKNKSGKSRMNEIRNAVKNITYCQKENYGCGAPVSKIKEEKNKSTATISLYAETNLENLQAEEGAPVFEKKKNRLLLTPDMVYDILKNISDTDCRILGLDPEKSRPEMMIYKVFPVPPVAIRPSSRADYMASSTLEDDLTIKLADIIKANTRIRKEKENELKKEVVSKYTNDHLHLLQYHVGTYFNNESLGVPKSEQKGRQVKSISSRLTGKEGWNSAL